jgi:hypothetical protein
VLPSCTTSLRRSLLSPARRAPTSGSRAAHSSRPPLKRAAHLYWCSCCTPQVDPGRAKARHPRARPVLVGLACRRSPPAPTPRPKSTGPSPLPYVVNVCFKCFRYFRGMLQVFHIDVTKVDRGVVYVASVLEACCKRLFKIFHLLQTYVANVLNWMLHMFCTYVARVCSKCFSCFTLMLQCVFMLQVVSVSFGCCICFTHIFQVYVINISSALDVGCIQLFHISEVESHGGTPRLPAGGWNAAS